MGRDAGAVLDPTVLKIDCPAVVAALTERIRHIVARILRRRGVVVAVSGGVDSAVCASLAVRALGVERVLALLMPERDTPSEATDRGKILCERLGIRYEVENISSILEAAGCYRRRDEAVRRLFPEFGPDYRLKIAIAGDLLEGDRLNYFNLIIQSPDGKQKRERMPVDVYLGVVAATNMKQRVRKLLEYYHAECRNYAVMGTPNRLEYELGFFVRGGDGLADLKPIAHLYKTQVYALAEWLDVPECIRRQVPSTDTYSLPQTQQEFYFALPYDVMDLALYAYLHNIPAESAAPVLGLSAEQVRRIYRDIAGKRRLAKQLDRPAILVNDTAESLDSGPCS